MWKGRSLRSNERGMGWLAHPGVLALIFFLVALAVLAIFVPLAVIVSVAVVLVLIGAILLGASAGLGNKWGVLLSFVLLIVGIVLLAFGAAVPF